ncbi:unnamed protein product, partial [marine sediment metagenome]
SLKIACKAFKRTDITMDDIENEKLFKPLIKKGLKSLILTLGFLFGFCRTQKPDLVAYYFNL